MSESTTTTQTMIDRAREVPGFNELPDDAKQRLVLKMLEKAAEAPPATYQRPQRVGEPSPALAQAAQTAQQAVAAPPSAAVAAPPSAAVAAPPSAADGGQFPPLEPGIQETFTDPREMALTIGSGLGTSAWARAGIQLAQSVASPFLKAALPYLGASAGSEVVNLVGKATAPGATLRSTLTPDMSDAVAIGAPLAQPFIAHPIQTVRAMLAPVARSSSLGKAAIYGEKKAGVEALNTNVQRYNEGQVAQEGMQQTRFEQAEASRKGIEDTRRAAVQQFNTQGTEQDALAKQAFEAAETAKQQGRQQAIANTEQYNVGQQAQKSAADNLVETANADARATYQLQREQRAQQLFQQRQQYRSEMESWQAVLEQNRAEKAAHAETLRGLDTAQRTGNVQQMQEFVDKLPGIPTKDVVDKAFADAQEEALKSGIAVVYPETQKLRTTLLQEAKTIEKGQGTTDLSRKLTKLGNASSELSLPEVQALLSDFKANVTGLRHNPSQYAARERQVYGRLIDAVEKDFEALAGADGTTAQFRYLVKRAQGLSLKQHTASDVEDWVKRDWLKTNPDGTPGFNARTALDALESDKYARTRGYMEKTMIPTANGKERSLYDLTKETLTTMQSADFQEAERMRRLTKTGDTPVPPRPDRVPLQAPLQKPALQTAPEPQFLTAPQPYQSKNYAPAFQKLPEPDPYKPQPFQSSTQYLTPTPMPEPGNMRSGPLALGADLGARTGLILGGAALGYGGSYGTAGVMGLAALGFPNAVTHLMMTERGQKTLLTLLREQGPQVTEALLGFVAAASRAVASPQSRLER